MKNITAAILLLSAVCTTPAFAGGPFYAGLQVGDGFTVLSGYMLSKTTAVELGYTNYGGNAYRNNCGRHTYCDNYYNYSSLGLLLVGSAPLGQALSMFGKIGLVSTTASSRATGTNYYTNDLSLGFGLGAQYDFTKKVSGRVGVDFDTYYANNLYIGAIYKF